MPRRRWIYKNGEAFEISSDAEVTPRAPTDSALWNDRLYQDDGDRRYNSRKQHREYMARNGLTTIDDWTNTWAKDEKERKAALAGRDPSRKQDVIEAFQRVREGHHHATRRRS